LTPEEAFARLKWAMKVMPYISTVGIAGPGDSLANPEKTFKTLELIVRKFPSLHICLSTNGLMLSDYVDELVSLKVSYITVTINSVNVDVAEKIYRWVRFKGKTYYDRNGASLLLERQKEGLQSLKDRGFFVKVNTLYIPGINSKHIDDVADTVGRYAHLINIMPFIPVDGSIFEGLKKPDKGELEGARKRVGKKATVMDHCRQCRSDACGLLHEGIPLNMIEERRWKVGI